MALLRHSCWWEAVRRSGADARAAALELARLERAYGKPGRRYHGLSHLDQLFQTASLKRRQDPRLVFAIYYHDAVYSRRLPFNEARSARWAMRGLRGLGVDAGLAAEVARWVRATARHRAPAGDAALAYFLDLDLSILGQAPSRYDAYAAAIAVEYSWMPATLYRRRRLAFLQAPGPLFQSRAFRRLEAPARRNRAREAARLLAQA